MAVAAIGAVVSIAQPAMKLLPEGINRVPSCEEPSDIVDFNLECDPLDPMFGKGDSPGDEPLVPVDLPAGDGLPSVAPSVPGPAAP